MNIATIFENNEEWIKQKLNENKDIFADSSQGQNPEILYIGCSDSRVIPEQIMGVKIGDVFVHRNIANQALKEDLNVQSIIYYAVTHLKIKHIVVCGHYGCGGVARAMEASDKTDLDNWLEDLRQLFLSSQKKFQHLTTEKEKYDYLVELNVKNQCERLASLPLIQKAKDQLGLQIHSWVYDMSNGRLTDLN